MRPWKSNLIPLWTFILWATRPLSYALSKVKWPLRIKRKIGSDFYYTMRDRIKTGDVVLTFTKGELSNIYNPSGDKKHGFIVVDAAKEIYLEAVGEGTRGRRLARVVEHYDAIAIYRLSSLTDAHRFRIAQHWQQFEGLEYDFFYEDEDYLRDGHKKALYCFELVVSIFQNLCGIDRDFLRQEAVKDKHVYGPYTFSEDQGFELILRSE
jgi:hypothetical protein